MAFKKITTLIMLSLIFNVGIFSQIIEVSPPFPTQNDIVTIHYDASQGNGGLVGVAPVYTHTGVVTQSGLPSSWSYVQGNWGQADPNVLMTDLGNNIHEIVIDIDQYYGFPANTNVAKLAFVFRNANGSIEGKTATMGDIFYPVYPVNGGFQAAIFHPFADILVNSNDTIPIKAQSNSNATLEVYDNGILITSASNSTIIQHDLVVNFSGDHEIILIANDGSSTISDTVNYTVIPPASVIDPPVGLVDGINYINDSTVTIKLYAPEKNTVNLIGDHNDWKVNTASFMNLSNDSCYWWKTITNLIPGNNYTYQYLVDGIIKIADPLSPLILDPNNDATIGTLNYPNPITYPHKTTGFVTVMQPGKTPYNWANNSFTKPANKDLVIYEILVRDYLATHSYLTLIDTLDYLSDLGINAIELMPPGEFENNESWGYNPSFQMALDKYYGTPDHFKAFIDSCHSRGIAVIIDIALNHAFGQNPMVNLYWDGTNSQPAANNPWFNATCPHPPYCWGYDFNHEVQATQNYIDRINHYWLNEYHIDGFRFDFTKGFINNSNGHDNTRIQLLQRMADTIWSVEPNAYVILEHWADNSEEKILAEYGMMLWGNVTHGYQESGMGYVSGSNLSWGVYKYRTWSVPHLISYMESHDEERIMYKNITYGNSSTNHNAKNPITALERCEALAVMMLTTPGPKMIWQFGELGYDISIDYPCRVCNKPILWNYFTENSRKRLYDVYKATIDLRKSHNAFTGDDFDYSLNQAVKTLKLNDPTLNAVVMSNIDVAVQDKQISFQHSGWWYEYFTGDSLQISGNTTISLSPGEYRVYTDMPLATPSIQNTVNIEDISLANWEVHTYPNPVKDFINVEINGSNKTSIKVTIVDVSGRIIQQQTKINPNNFNLNLSELQKGIYHLILEQNHQITSKKIIKN
jgi:glycosidase